MPDGGYRSVIADSSERAAALACSARKGGRTYGRNGCTVVGHRSRPARRPGAGAPDGGSIGGPRRGGVRGRGVTGRGGTGAAAPGRLGLGVADRRDAAAMGGRAAATVARCPAG